VHEIGIAQGILDVVHDVAHERAVQRVRVRIGSLHAVSGDSLEFGFQLVTVGTNAAGATLEIDEVPGDELTVDEVEVAGDPPEIMRRPHAEVEERPHGGDHDVHRHPAWL
jgi:Zn finger protein HypA/HybF involved in hydrogenase expression